ncbi:MAG: polysaccharide biosynthesis/export family protein [Nitrospirae bacterium]|nr:polysaccharide biosynthesis/export family protein [Nitrospirota bacterium]
MISSASIRFLGAAALVPALVLILSGCGGYQISSDTRAYVDSLGGPGETGNLLTQYLVGPEDVLEVKVWGDEALSKRVAVRPDGKVTLPLVGDVVAAGRSSVEIAADFAQLLKEYKSAPQVEVNIAEINSYRIYLLGEVNQPGMIQVRNFTTLLQGIALAGGPTRFASNEILLMRQDRESGHERVLQLDYRLLSSDRAEHRAYNLVLWPGDTIIIK